MLVYFFKYYFICRSDFTVSEDAEIEPRIDATSSLAARGSNHSARYISSTDSARFNPLSAKYHFFTSILEASFLNGQSSEISDFVNLKLIHICKKTLSNGPTCVLIYSMCHGSKG